MFGVGVIVIGVMLSIFQHLSASMWCCTTRRKCSKRWGQHGYRAVADHYCRSYQPHLHVLAIMTVDKFGRKPLQIIGGSEWQSVCLASVPRFTLRHRYCGATVDAVLCCRLCHVLGSVCWVLLSEIFPNAIRGKALESRWRPSGWRTTSSPGPSR